MTTSPAAHRSLLANADLCVKCGLCLPHCPTYAQTRHEGDSPRGRIALIQGLATGALPLTDSLESHLDGCLACRACERVCPAQVPYGRLIDEGRAWMAAQRPQRTRLVRLIGALLSSNTVLRILDALLWLYRASGAQHLVRRSGMLGRGRLARLESLLPPRTPRRAPARPPSRHLRGRVSLFTGCVGRLVDTQTLSAVQRLFERFGYRVERPAGQTCCGAIHAHGGLPDAARRNAERNLHAFADAQSIVHSASGCGATLVDYPLLLPGSAPAQRFADRLEDVCAALLARWPPELHLRPLRARVAVHLPCTQRNVLGGAEQIYTLLRKIPGIELVDLDPAQRCCGAAGLYFVTQAQMADALLERKLAAVARLRPDYIISTNIGCSLHLAGGLRRHAGPAPEVLHPATLVARQLPED
ncbi:glycolate oxidase iron-sulfur subunit [Fontimonas thermophila]|uniref:Glycolate oxidase iron-sulfur subunit n=1 Tax=Fontimonas thermophila TaxID=1076937 RepID=A0A1I2I7S7_9GAMM|nr:heterodisulfide reductase-related iron-sulfur binding cluster [Fontimonas thermophila]SFF36946.1 glycolate oxidase iron-sulfur subunit [Fontimonas thermophila]